MAQSQNEKNKYLTPSYWQQYNAIFNSPKTEAERLMEQRMAVQAPKTYLGSQTAKFLGALLGYSFGQGNNGEENMGVNEDTTQALADNINRENLNTLLQESAEQNPNTEWAKNINSQNLVDIGDMSFGINPENPYPNPMQDYLNKVNAGKPKFGDNLSSLIQRLGWG